MAKDKDSIGEIRHKINNLLTNISLSAELLEKEFYGTLNEKQKKCLKIISDNEKKIETWIQKLEK